MSLLLARVSASSVLPPVSGGGGGGVWGSRGLVAPRMSREQERRLEKAIADLARASRQARTPRVRQKKLLEAENAALDAMTIAPPEQLQFVVPEFDLSEVLLMLRQIIAGVVDYPAIRAELLARVEVARLKTEALRRKRVMMAAAILLLT